MKNTIQLTKLRLDGGTQPRVRINMDVVRDYAERINAGDDFPPVDVFHDGAEHWLAEGFHRYHAYKEAGHKVVPCTLRKGTVRDAILFSCGANVHHGLRRTPADKQKAVQTVLSDEEWSKEFSDRKVAEICCVSHEMVRQYRAAQVSTLTPESKRTGRDGKQYKATNPQKTREEATTSATVSYPFTCQNCGGHSTDEDGDCSKCCEPSVEREPGDDTEAIKAEQEKRRASGKEKISAKDRKAALSAFGVVVRFFDKTGRHDDYRSHLEAVLEGIKS